VKPTGPFGHIHAPDATERASKFEEKSGQSDAASRVSAQVKVLGLRRCGWWVQDFTQLAAAVFPSGGAQFVSAPVFPFVIISRWAPAVSGSPGWSKIPDVRKPSHGKRRSREGVLVGVEP
jgi:hypothetical protein